MIITRANYKMLTPDLSAEGKLVMKKNTYIKFNKPADNWYEALPLGNGSFGAMFFGTIDAEKIQLNQESVWSSGKRERINSDAKEALPEVRKLILDGQLEDAEELIYTKMLADPITLGHYEPLADIKLVFDKKIGHYSEWFTPKEFNVTNYVRVLDMQNSIYECSYERDGVNYKREAFISYPDQVMAIKITSSEKIGMRLELSRGTDFEALKVEGNIITLSGAAGKTAPEYVAMACVLSDGEVSKAGFYIDVKSSTSITIYVAGRTSFYGENPFDWCKEKLIAAEKKGYDKMKADHIEDVEALFNRVEIDLGEEDQAKYSAERFYNFGRYLTIASSRPGCLPANLQGIWNDDMNPAWGSRYTTNINVQMNYWLAESANLSECHMPLIEFIRKMIPDGKKVAREMYGCRGAVAHHNTDIYGDCAPNEHWMPASLWPMGLAWLGTHIIEHYRYTKDISFAKEYFEELEEISVFFLDFLIPDREGYLVTCPSTSPENTYILENGQKSTVCYGPAMDAQILYELWSGVLEIAKECGISDDITEEISKKINLLPKDKIGSRGQLLEWQQEYEEWEKGHRHISHLFGLYPGHSISKSKDIDIYNAARKTLEERLAHGGGGTGWSRSWVINFWASLGDGEKAYSSLLELLKEQTAPNMFDLHPFEVPGINAVFQIDGNFGGAAGIAEMLVQTEGPFKDGTYEIKPLPALPKAWKNGHVKGMKIRGNKEIDMSWENGEITKFEVY